jgi:hypothetical protein
MERVVRHWYLSKWNRTAGTRCGEDHGWKKPVLGLEHTSGEALWRVVFPNRNSGLGEDRSPIVRFVH